MLAFVLYKSYLDRKESKYRELAIINCLALLLFLLIKVNSDQVKQISDNTYRQSVHFIEIVAEKNGVPETKVYVNTSTAVDGAIIKVEDKFYRVIGNGETFLLEKIEFYNEDIELVEVEK